MSRRRVKTSFIRYDRGAEAYFYTQESGEWPHTLSWHAVAADGWSYKGFKPHSRHHRMGLVWP